VDPQFSFDVVDLVNCILKEAAAAAASSFYLLFLMGLKFSQGDYLNTLRGR
jgi:hypothetical protein